MSVSDDVTQKLWSFVRSQRGGAAVELVVIFPVLLLLFIGAVDYGRLFFTSITVSNAARAGAEYGARDISSSADTASMNAFAQQDGQEAGTLALASRRYCECAGAPNGSCSACSGGAAPDVFIEVTATRAVAMSLPYPGLPSSITVSRKATFRIQ